MARLGYPVRDLAAECGGVAAIRAMAAIMASSPVGSDAIVGQMRSTAS